MLITKENIIAWLTPVNFEYWLHQHNSEDKVGVTRDGRVCPIASYLADNIKKYKEPHDTIGKVEVDAAAIAIYQTDSFALRATLITPEWAAQFIHKIDDLPLLYPQYEIEKNEEIGEEYETAMLEHITVTAQQSLEILEDAVEAALELECESQEIMNREYGLNV